MSKLTLTFLGPPRLLRNGAAVEPDTRKAVALLAYLAMTGQQYTRDSLAALLYPEYDDAHARGALRRTLSSLHKALGNEHLLINRERVGLLDSADIWIDTRRFETLITQADQHTKRGEELCAECVTKLEAAVELYRGDFLAGFSLRDSPEFDDWKFFQGESLRRKFSSALERLARYYRLHGMIEPAVETSRRWLALDALLEDAHRELMRAYAQAGQRNAALRQYNECARILEKELGVEPLEETRELYRTILEYRYQPVSVVALERQDTASEAFPAIDSQPQHSFPLTGREGPWENLLDIYRLRARSGFFVAIEGEPGIGKTRLAEEMIAFAASQGAVILTTRCFEGESGLAYAPIIELLHSAFASPASVKIESVAKPWLAESARLAADLHQRFPELPEPALLSSPGAQSAFFEGLRQTLFCLTQGSPPGVIFFDDAHWADSASIDLLAYLIRRLSGHPLLFILAWRDGDSSSQSRLRALLAEGQRSNRAAGIHLDRLSAADVSRLVDAIGQKTQGISASFNQRLYEESEGLPLMVVEYLETILTQAGAEDGKRSVFPSAEVNWQIPDNTRDVFLRRIAALDDLTRQLLTAASVIGRSFDFATLAAVAGRSEPEAISGLEILVSHGLVQEAGAVDGPEQMRFDFTHAKLRSLVYDETSQVRRRLLHLRAANVLAEAFQHGAPSGMLAGQVAQHYRLAGEAQSAARYYRIAGDEARRLFANRQALELYQAAFDLSAEKPFDLYENMGDLHTLLGEYQAALESYRQARSHVDSSEASRLTHKIGNVHLRRGEWDAAAEKFQQVLDAFPDIQDDLAARCLADRSLAVMQMGRLDEAEGLAEQALERAGCSEAAPALAQAHNLLGILLRRRKQFDAAESHLNESLKLGRQMADAILQTAALNNLALLAEESGDLATALDYTQKALALCEKLGDRHRAAALHNHLADLYQHTGQTALAMEHLKHAVTTFAEIGGSAEDIQPEIWKLTEW